jgi:hypothetical protein
MKSGTRAARARVILRVWQPVADGLLVMLMEWPGVTREQYNRVMSELGLDTKPPAGGMFHVAAFGGGSLRVLDIWESQETFERFQRERLADDVRKAGITSQPSVEFFPAHDIYAPNIETIRKAGASSLPVGASSVWRSRTAREHGAPRASPTPDRRVRSGRPAAAPAASHAEASTMPPYTGFHATVSYSVSSMPSVRGFEGSACPHHQAE